MTVQIKILETVYTPQDLEKAAAYGAEGYGNVLDMADAEHYVFSKEHISDSEELIDKLREVIFEEGYSVGDTFYVDETKYEIV